jgi:hypothetical protein
VAAAVAMVVAVVAKAAAVINRWLHLHSHFRVSDTKKPCMQGFFHVGRAQSFF